MEAGAERGEQNEIPRVYSTGVYRLGESKRNRGRSCIPVLVDVDVDLFIIDILRTEVVDYVEYDG